MCGIDYDPLKKVMILEFVYYNFLTLYFNKNQI